MSYPLYCDIGITERCLLKCRMCRFWQAPVSEDELSIDEWKELIISLDDFAAKDIRLHFAGGEPLLKKGILELIEFAHRRGFTTVMVTNGFLIDEPMAEKIARSGLDVISISLDSLDAGIHDYLRGEDGVFDRVMRAIGYLDRYAAKSVSILTVVTGYNLDGLIRLVDWVNENSSLSSIYLQAVSQPIATSKDSLWYTCEEFKYLWPQDTEKLRRIMDTLIDYKGKNHKLSNSVRQLETFKSYFKDPHKFSEGLRCNQGDYSVYIRPTGEALLCGSMASIGNVRKKRIQELWNSEEAALRRKEIYNCRESCLNVINCFVDKELL